MKNLLYALGILGASLVAGNSYSQETSVGFVKIENVKKEFRQLDTAAKNLASTIIYTNPTAIDFNSLDSKTKSRAWNILSNHYELELEQQENKLKDYESCKTKNAELQKASEKLVSDNKALTLEIKTLKEKYEPVDEKDIKKK